MEENEIISIIKNHCLGQSPIAMDLDLVTNLQIDGDDADELFEKLLSRKQIELPINQLNSSFHSEGELLDFMYVPKQLLYKLGLRFSPALRPLEPFTVKDLVELFTNESI